MDVEVDSLFYGGPPLRLEERLRICRHRDSRVLRRAAVVALLGWVPLVVIAALQPLVFPGGGLSSLARDIPVHCRSLIAAPLFILAEAACTVRLAAMAQHFVQAGLVRERDLPQFESAKLSTRRLRDSPLAEAIVVVLAYAVVGALIYSGVVTPEWHRGVAGPLGPFSLAGWWNALVSLPLLLVLFMGWLWRVFLWGRFLWLMARLDLALVPSHPDLAGGLKFVSYSIRAFAPVGLAMGVVVAGAVANGVFMRGHALLTYRPAAIALAVFVTLAFCAPVTVFATKLRQTWTKGVFQYGAIASGLGREFERKWLTGKPVTEAALSVSDFSEVTDLYQVVGNVYEMRFVPIELRSVLQLVGMTLLPLVPVVLLSLPLDVIVKTVTRLLF
jgi:hypothetical protein